MQTNILNIAIAVLVSALLAYGFWSMGSPLANYLAVGSFLFLGGTLIPGVGMRSGSARMAVNQTVLAGIFFSIGIIINLIFALLGGSAVFYIIASAVLYLIYIFVSKTLHVAHT